MISLKQIILGSAEPIIAIFSSNENVLGADDWFGLLFINTLRDVAMATDLVKKMANSPFSSLWHSETEWNIATTVRVLTAQMMPVYHVKISGNLVQ